MTTRQDFEKSLFRFMVTTDETVQTLAKAYGTKLIYVAFIISDDGKTDAYFSRVPREMVAPIIAEMLDGEATHGFTLPKKPMESPNETEPEDPGERH